jgi:putative hydrolase of the HAD superfamily
MTTPRLVIFDMDDVLCHYSLGRRLRYLGQLAGKSARDVQAAIWDSGFEGESDSGGYPDAEDYLREFGERLGYPITRTEWVDARRLSMTPRHDVLSLAKDIGARAELAVFTNNGPVVEQEFETLFPEAAPIFARRFCSYQFATKKPDPAVYTRLLAKLDIPPSETWFVDDKRSNVQGARLAGLRAHHFTGFAPLHAEAAALGLAKPVAA